jgi:hypothetical protein
MRIPRTTLIATLLTALWTGVGLICFLMCVQLLLLIYAPKGTWHLPKIYRVTVREFDSQPQDSYSTIITGKNVRPAPEDEFSAEPKDGKGAKDEAGTGDEAPEGAASKESPRSAARPGLDPKELEQDDPDEFEDQSIALMKSERKDLKVGDSFWVLDNYYRSPLRPPQFRLTPVRLLIEFPEPLLVLALLGIFWLRKSRAAAVQAEAEAPRERVLLRDDFHERANRFKEPEA